MENLIFCLNATMPIFITMVLGWVFRQIGLMDDQFVTKLNKFVFTAALPSMLFEDMAEADFAGLWNGRFVAFCVTVTLLGVLVAVVMSLLVKDRTIRGEFTQAAFRSNTAIL